VIKSILKARPHSFRRSKALAAAIESTGFLGVFTAEGDRWARQRRHVMKGLRPQVVNASQDRVNKVVWALAKKWRAVDPGQVDVLIDLKRAASDIVVATSLGVDLQSFEGDEPVMQRAIDQWFSSIGRRARLPGSIYRLGALIGGNEDQKAIKFIRSVAEKAVVDAKQSLIDGDGTPQNILEALIVAQQEDGDAYTDEDIVGNAVTMILAGQETTASSMAWLMYYLARNPELVRQLRTRLDRVFANNERVVDSSIFDEVPELQRLCLEVLRLKPTAPLFGLMANHDISVAGLKLSAGQKVVLLARERVDPRHDSPSLKTNGSKSSEQSRSANDSIEGFAFGAGPRLCPGRYLALLEMMTMTIMVVRNFDVQINDRGAPISEGYTFAMHPRNLHFMVRSRALDTTA